MGDLSDLGDLSDFDEKPETGGFLKRLLKRWFLRTVCALIVSGLGLGWAWFVIQKNSGELKMPDLSNDLESMIEAARDDKKPFDLSDRAVRCRLAGRETLMKRLDCLNRGGAITEFEKTAEE